ncbi:MAG TPA: hypothetical protein VH880_15505 [Anaeromyxobacteraceae bacterium]
MQAGAAARPQPPRAARTSRSARSGPAGAPAAASRPAPPRTSAPPGGIWAPGPAAKPPAGYAAAAPAGGEWAFLDSKSLSIEDKLFRFMAKVMEKIDKELVDKMKAYKAQFGAQSAGGTSQKKGSSLFDVAKAVFPALGLAEQVFGREGLRKAASSLGGPLLAGLATAVGLPALAPVALRYGGDLAELAFKQSGSTGSSAAGSSGGSSAGPAGSPDEKVAMLELQVLVEKQARMFAAVSGALKAMHDAEMVAVHNLR